MWRCQTSIGLHKPIWMNLEWMIHRISQPPSYPSNTFGKSGLTKVLLGGLLCLLLQLLKQRTSRLTHKKSHPTYWHIGWRPSMPLPNAPSLPPEAKTTWIMLQHVEITMKSVIFNVNIKKKSTATEAGAVCSNSERRLILRLNLHKFPDHEITTNQSLDWKRLRRRI